MSTTTPAPTAMPTTVPVGRPLDDSPALLSLLEFVVVSALSVVDVNVVDASVVAELVTADNGET